MAETRQPVPDLSDIQPDRLIKYRVSEDKMSAEVLLPGLSYTDFDKKIGGKWTLWSMTKFFECFRYTAFPGGFFHYMDIRDEQHSLFMASSEYHMTPLFNSIRGRTHWGINFPLYVKGRVIYAGKSSFTFDSILYDFQTGEKIITTYMTFVYVDFKTRKPAPFPDWLLAKTASLNNQIPRLEVIPIPPDAFKYETRSAPSETDFNQHVNQSIYVKWCTDAGTEAALNGNYKRFDDNIGKYVIKKIQVKYVAEGAVNEDFVTHTWQDANNRAILHFVVTKEGKIVFVARFSYYDDFEQSRL